MDNYCRNDMRLLHLQLRAGQHTIQLARLAAAFGAFIESGRMMEELHVPAEELAEVPDLDDLADKEADMPLGEAVQILEDFFEMGVEGEARLEVMLGFGDE